MNQLPIYKQIGILGGGQLSRMMCLQGHQLGLNISVLSGKANDPAALVTNRWVKGDPSNISHVQSFLKTVDVCTFESEFIDTSKLKSSKFQPTTNIMREIRDRLTQKNLIEKNKFKTAKFYDVTNLDELNAAANKLNYSFVLKKRTFGYDGFGTFIIKNKNDFNKVKKTTDLKLGFIAEELIDFKRELSFIFARSKNGDIASLPLVETFQKNAQCFWVKGPVKTKGEANFIKKTKTFLDKINYVGVIAFEVFDTKHGFYVNELAPRVHNTGHHSLNSLNIDQFSLHLLCICGAKLPKIKTLTGGFAMVNLIGSGRKKIVLNISDNSWLHWYAKEENRKGRKMGHINVTSKSPQSSLKIALNSLKEIKI